MAKTKYRDLAAVHVSMGAGSIAAADGTRASEQAKACAWMLKHQYKEPKIAYHPRNMQTVVAKRAAERAAAEARPTEGR